MGREEGREGWPRKVKQCNIRQIQESISQSKHTGCYRSSSSFLSPTNSLHTSISIPFSLYFLIFLFFFHFSLKFNLLRYVTIISTSLSISLCLSFSSFFLYLSLSIYLFLHLIKIHNKTPRPFSTPQYTNSYTKDINSSKHA